MKQERQERTCLECVHRPIPDERDGECRRWRALVSAITGALLQTEEEHRDAPVWHRQVNSQIAAVTLADQFGRRCPEFSAYRWEQQEE